MTLTALAKASIINTEAKLRIGSKEWVGVYSAPYTVSMQHNFCEGMYLLFNSTSSILVKSPCLWPLVLKSKIANVQVTFQVPLSKYI